MNIAKPDETADMYQKNLDLLPQWLRNDLENISEDAYKEKVEVTYNSDGYPVCRCHRDGECFHVTSAHPIEEAKAWGQAVNLQDAAEIFVYGCGFGYALFELFAQKPVQALVIVFEWDICLFSAMLHYFDMSPLVQTQKVIFFAGCPTNIKKAFIEYLVMMLYDITTFPTVIFTLSAARNFKKEYLEIHRHIFEQLSFVMSSVGNSHQDDMTGLRNLLANTKEYLRNPYLSCLKDKYAGTAAIIVSNGPSLDKSIPLLKQIQGKCLMVCAESAIVPLTKNGITPDIMCALERTKTNYLFHFKNRNHSSDIVLCALGMVDPRIFPSFAGEKMPVFRKGEGLSRWFNKHLGDGSELDAGASVAHLALSTAIYLGADPIIFVGQDLAYGQDGATHSKDAVLMQEQGKKARDIIHANPTVYVEGNNGEMLPSNRIWVNFLFIMESLISLHPEHVFYNATEGGAKIQGTKRAKLAELVEQYCTGPLPCRVTDLIANEKKSISVAERAKLLDNMIADVEHYVGFFRKISHEANIKKLESERMMVLCAGKDEEKYQDLLDETYQNNLASFYRYREDELGSYFTQRLLCAYFYLFAQIGVIDTQQKRAQIFELHKLFFLDLRAVAQSLSVTFEEAALSLAAVREELTGEAV